jgi:hypothetical protein
MTGRVTLFLAAILLLAVDWLMFHDLFEPHSVRDYMTLVASLLVFACLGRMLLGPRDARAGA